jgi:hypothetical protein
MAGTIVADNIQAASTSTLVLKNGVANTPPTIQDSAGTQIGTFCRAWVNFNGTGTVAITASFNCSSITDNGVGDYTVNFTNALPDANYNFVGNGSNTNNTNILCAPVLNWDNPTKTTSALRIFNVKTTNGAATDQNTISISVFR